MLQTFKKIMHIIGNRRTRPQNQLAPLCYQSDPRENSCHINLCSFGYLVLKKAINPLWHVDQLSNWRWEPPFDPSFDAKIHTYRGKHMCLISLLMTTYIHRV